MENCVHVLPPFRLYCQMSEVAEGRAGYLKSIGSNAGYMNTELWVRSDDRIEAVTEVDAVIVPMDTPE